MATTKRRRFTLMKQAEVSQRTRVRRLPERGRYDRQTIHAILDEALIVHVGFAMDGQSYVIPTTYVRLDDAIYIHGSAASRMLEVAAAGAPLCATVTLLDGLVFARSAFHHSMNYRSVVALGQGFLVSEPAEKLRVLAALVDRFATGRYAEVRAPSPLELKATLVIGLSLAEASAKVRGGPPKDDADDLAIPCWAGVVPIRTLALPPLAESGLPEAAQSPSLPAALR